MIISGKNLRLYYWMYTKSGGGPANLPEIEKEEYGYELLPGKILCALRYDMTNLECYFRCKVLDANDEGLLIASFIPERQQIFVPWVKVFPVPAPKGPLIKCDLYIEPCECLYEKNKLEDILKGKIDDETVVNGKIITRDGHGIWHMHGGQRTVSRYEENLRNFISLGQQSLI